MKQQREYTQQELDRMVQMGWEDRTPFEAIERQFGISHNDFNKFMRSQMTASSFRMWRKRMNGRQTKHQISRPTDGTRFRCSRQRDVY